MAKSLEDYTPSELVALAQNQTPKVHLYDTLMSDPETRRDMLALTKKKYPSMVIPELDAKAEMDTKLAEERTAREKLENELREERVTRRMKEDRESALAKNRLSDSDLPEIEKLMVEAKIPDYNTAAELYSLRRRQAEPTPASMVSPTFDMPEKSIWGSSIGNNSRLNKTAIDLAVKASNEFRSGKVVQQ